MKRPAAQRTAVGRAVVLPLLLGLALRALFIAFHPRFAGDALVYAELARNMLTHHVYGLYTDGHLLPTLIRLPGYPLFLAACFKLFGDGNFLAVVWVQAAIDLGTCGLMAALAHRLAGPRAGRWTLWLAALCPFTANYVAVPIAETCSFFCVALAFWALERWREAWPAAHSAQGPAGQRAESAWLQPCRKHKAGDAALAAEETFGEPKQRSGMRWACLTGLALAWAVLLRPEQGLLAAAVVPVMLWVGWRRGPAHLLRRAEPAVLAALIVALPLTFWAARNWSVFHLIQPLAPKYANDPGEAVTSGFNRWFRTWAVGYPATVNVYWRYDGDPMDVNDLPPRAFDSPQQRAETAAIYAQYNEEDASTPAVDAEFARLAAERVHENPFRYYVELPIARELDMWFRPRIELLRIPLDWWRLRAHPRKSLLAYAFGALNILYLGFAAVGALLWLRAPWTRRSALGWAMALFVAFRCALLLTIDNSEPRYVLECYPVVILLGALAVARLKYGRRFPAQQISAG